MWKNIEIIQCGKRHYPSLSRFFGLGIKHYVRLIFPTLIIFNLSMMIYHLSTYFLIYPFIYLSITWQLFITYKAIHIIYNLLSNIRSLSSPYVFSIYLLSLYVLPPIYYLLSLCIIKGYDLDISINLTMYIWTWLTR